MGGVLFFKGHQPRAEHGAWDEEAGARGDRTRRDARGGDTHPRGHQSRADAHAEYKGGQQAVG
jgi:hypothetical protein